MKMEKIIHTIPLEIQDSAEQKSPTAPATSSSWMGRLTQTCTSYLGKAKEVIKKQLSFENLKKTAHQSVVTKIAPLSTSQNLAQRIKEVKGILAAIKWQIEAFKRSHNYPLDSNSAKSLERLKEAHETTLIRLEHLKQENNLQKTTRFAGYIGKVSDIALPGSGSSVNILINTTCSVGNIVSSRKIKAERLNAYKSCAIAISVLALNYLVIQPVRSYFGV